MRVPVDPIYGRPKGDPDDDEHGQPRIEGGAREERDEPVIARKLSVGPDDGKSFPCKRPHRERNEEGAGGDVAGNHIARSSAKGRANSEAQGRGTEEEQDHEQAPNPGSVTRVDPIEEKPVAVKYVEVDSCWQEDEANEEREGKEGLHAPHGGCAMANLVEAGVGRESACGDGDEQQEK